MEVECALAGEHYQSKGNVSVTEATLRVHRAYRQLIAVMKVGYI